MKQTITRTFFGEDAKFFIGKFIKIAEITELDRERSAVEITFEAEN